MSWFAGIDIGSTGTKVALWNGGELELLVRPTGWDPKEAAEGALLDAVGRRGVGLRDIGCVIATGYGRSCIASDGAVTEITCLAAGASRLAGDFSVVLDIGGQDCKAVLVDERGKVSDFLMNDKCAAGTGRFIQNMAVLLGYSLDDFARLPESFGAEPINSMCTVFAETEVIAMISKGVPKESIALGVLDSVAVRAASMASKLPSGGRVVFTGGAAVNPILARLLERRIGRPIITPQHPQFAGAVGAAVIAAERYGGRDK